MTFVEQLLKIGLVGRLILWSFQYELIKLHSFIFWTGTLRFQYFFFPLNTLATLATVGFKLKRTKSKAYHIEKEFKEQWIADWCPVVYVIWIVGVPENIQLFCPDLEAGMVHKVHWKIVQVSDSIDISLWKWGFKVNLWVPIHCFNLISKHIWDWACHTNFLHFLSLIQI
jgi:hypothetical protein